MQSSLDLGKGDGQDGGKGKGKGRSRGKGEGKDGGKCHRLLYFKEKRLHAEVWGRAQQGGSHFPLCVFTDNPGRRSDPKWQERDAKARSRGGRGKRQKGGGRWQAVEETGKGQQGETRWRVKGPAVADGTL